LRTRPSCSVTTAPAGPTQQRQRRAVARLPADLPRAIHMVDASRFGRARLTAPHPSSSPPDPYRGHAGRIVRADRPPALHERGSDLYAFCTRVPARDNSKTPDLALEKEADGGIRTLDPRFTRATWGRSAVRRGRSVTKNIPARRRILELRGGRARPWLDCPQLPDVSEKCPAPFASE
jgi:hypothetical protein